MKPTSDLWRAFDPESMASDIQRPYWAFAWSGGQSLARYLLDNPDLAKGKRILDFGSGCGITAIAAAKTGAASVLASDIDPVAIRAITMNGRINGVDVDTCCEDLIFSENRGWDLILAGDIWYTTRLSRHGLNWLRKFVDEGCEVLAADPGRQFSPSRGLKPLTTYSARSVPDVEHPGFQEVVVSRVLPSEDPADAFF
ncbi:MAG: class I SAM-dependent methyltransferase [Desulfococcaceae bacterium]